MKKILYIIVLSSLFGCNAQHKSLQTVNAVDLNKYSGLWYEIASFPQSFQKGCRCTTAEYFYTEKGVRILNKCQKPEGFTKIEGKAFVVEGSGNAKLKVQFFWPFKGDYWIIALEENYKWAVVGNKSRKYLWILSRLHYIPEKEYLKILEIIKEKGFDVSKLVSTQQDCK